MSILKIGFSRSKKKLPILAWLIMLCERTRFSHTYVKFPVKRWDLDLTYHAVGTGVNFAGPHEFNEHHQVVEEFSIEISDEAKDKLLKWCAENAGRAYSKKQILGMLLKRTARLFGIKIKNPLPESGAYICSELVAFLITMLGKQPPEDLESMGLVETRDMVLNLVDECSKIKEAP